MTVTDILTEKERMEAIGRMKKVKGFLLLGVATGLIMPMTYINLHYVDEKYGSTDGYFYHLSLIHI